jgi:nitrogen-specific signal transduction histidine kinase
MPMDKELEAWVHAHVVKKQNIAYALVDEQLHILASNEALSQWAIGSSNNIIEQSLLELFPEMIGVEDILRQLAHDPDLPFVLPQIQRSSPDGATRYFNLEIEPLPQFGHVLLVIITDVTAQTRLEQQLQQQQHELSLQDGTILSGPSMRPDD